MRYEMAEVVRETSSGKNKNKRRQGQREDRRSQCVKERSACTYEGMYVSAI